MYNLYTANLWRKILFAKMMHKTGEVCEHYRANDYVIFRIESDQTCIVEFRDYDKLTTFTRHFKTGFFLTAIEFFLNVRQ